MQSKAFFLDPKNAKKLSGTLFLTKECLTFAFDDFEQSNLQWTLQRVDIQNITLFRLFNIANAGIHIFSKNDK